MPIDTEQTPYERQHETLRGLFTGWKRGRNCPPGANGKPGQLTHVVLRYNDGLEKEATRWSVVAQTVVPEFVDGIYSYIGDHIQGFRKGLKPRYRITVHFDGNKHWAHEYPINTDHFYPSDEALEVLGYQTGSDMSALIANGRGAEANQTTALEIAKIALSHADADKSRALNLLKEVLTETRNENRALRDRDDLRAVQLETARDGQSQRDMNVMNQQFNIWLKQRGVEFFERTGPRLLAAFTGDESLATLAPPALPPGFEQFIDLPNAAIGLMLRKAIEDRKITRAQAEQLAAAIVKEKDRRKTAAPEVRRDPRIDALLGDDAVVTDAEFETEPAETVAARRDDVVVRPMPFVRAG